MNYLFRSNQGPLFFKSVKHGFANELNHDLAEENALEYYKDGWGLHPYTLIDIYQTLKSFDKDLITVVEFGSGMSTQFCLKCSDSLKLNLSITSFDHSSQYCFNSKDDRVDLKMRQLVQYDQEDFDDLINQKIDLKDVSITPLSDQEEQNTRVKNTFYSINEGDLPESIDMAIIDGPNGNGRSLAATYLKPRMTKGSLILIDDYFHYPFVDDFRKCFAYEIVSEFKSIDNSRILPYHKNKGSVLLRIL